MHKKMIALLVIFTGLAMAIAVAQSNFLAPTPTATPLPSSNSSAAGLKSRLNQLKADQAQAAAERQAAQKALDDAETARKSQAQNANTARAPAAVATKPVKAADDGASTVIPAAPSTPAYSNFGPPAPEAKPTDKSAPADNKKWDVQY